MTAQEKHINQLLNRCKQSDQNAQMQIYKAYYKAMYNTAFRILKDEFEAEDIMQEAFLTAFTKLDSFNKDGVSFGGWLKRIVINKSLTQLKRSSKYQEVTMDVIPDYDADEKAEEKINYTDLKVNQVLTIISRLKDNYRVVLNLNLVEGYDYDEIAEILGYTNENVRTTISRAKRKLKQELIENSLTV